MKNLSRNKLCEKCGGSVALLREGNTQGLICTNCGWSVVTTQLSEILRDPISYEVSVTKGDYRNDQHLKTLAHLADINYLHARKLLKESCAFVVFTGKASKAIEVRDTLETAGLAFEIKPGFPW